ncbi:beta-ketoacyl synthase N-terminal-like domain-containing protein [Micromonospora sp. NPDC007271]|uniref:beta-ketoacyl synthase N-terminal-like domain-containing protein n=1 Tax=Micromonospora sp. NPDC007271 TaxID=3154587 RepID=UPI0033D5589D
MTEAVLVTGVAVATAAGRGAEASLAAVLAGRPTFAEVRRFDCGASRTRAAATLPDARSLAAELREAVDTACRDGGLGAADLAETPLLLAAGTGTTLRRADRAGDTAGAAGLATRLAERCGLAGAARAYTAACVAGSSALAEAASMIAYGRLERAVVAGGFLVDADHQALFDAGRALADDGQVRPFSRGRRGMLLGDGIAAVVLESATAAGRRAATARGRLAGWGRAGDAYHVCQPDPAGAGLARAITRALSRAGVAGGQIDYVNANGTGTSYADAAEAAALRVALADHADAVPVSSTKSVHGHALEASGVVEFVITVLALGAGRLPVNAGFVAPDDDCRLDGVVRAPARAELRHALSLNFAFGGANSALVVSAA